jgi:2Fe-2S iron-sulfur cluster binding domain
MRNESQPAFYSPFITAAFIILYFPSSLFCYTHGALPKVACRSVAWPMIESDLYDPFEKLVGIEILGKRVEVPENNHLLRCFQYLSMKTISYGDFCWNGECTNCQVWYHTEGQTEREDKPALSCRLKVMEGMVVSRVSRFVELEGINK